MSVRGILQAATYKKGANMKCMLFVLGALFGLKIFNHGKTKSKIKKLKKKTNPTNENKPKTNKTKTPTATPLARVNLHFFFSLCGANFAFFFLSWFFSPL